MSFEQTRLSGSVQGVRKFLFSVELSVSFHVAACQACEERLQGF